MVYIKNIPSDGYVWGHFATSLVHIMLAGALFWAYYEENEYETLRRYLIIVGSILLGMSILAMVPVLKWYRTNTKIVIDMRKGGYEN